MPRTFCPETIELSTATPIYCCPNGKDFIYSINYLHYHKLSHFHSVYTSLPPSPKKENIWENSPTTKLIFIRNPVHIMQLTTWLKSSICWYEINKPIIAHCHLHWLRFSFKNTVISNFPSVRNMIWYINHWCKSLPPYPALVICSLYMLSQ